ncbi:restriction endonuclease subunit S [Dysgonomonadaceae bacterium zrk40]|nr:restriction endonuclease subunit S [Dysgonomonadaceae bacterium zrk40]
MSRIEQLIAELCPDGVEWKELGEVCSIFDGTHQTPHYTNEGIKFVSVENISSLYETKKYISKVDFDKLYRVKPQLNDIFMTRIGTIGACAIVDRDDDLAFYVTLTLIRPFQNIVNSRFIKYIIESSIGQKELIKRTLVYAVPIKINLGEIGKIKIPIPPLPIQQEIVRILDTFTDLDAELQAELEARKKQYEHYRNQLLNFEGKEVEWKMLGDLTDFMNGKGHEKEIVENGKYIVVNSKFISTDGTIKKYSNNQLSPIYIDDILIVMSDLPNGKALAKCFYVEKDNVYTLNQRIGRLSVNYKYEVTPKYIFFILNRNKQLLKYDNGSDQTNLRKNHILEIKIPIPPLAEQERIVSILDKFEALVNDELPAEIAARRKQYEHYREKLLTFEPLVS